MNSEWLTRIEAARYARMSVATFSRRIRAGTMPLPLLLDIGGNLNGGVRHFAFQESAS